MSSPTCTFEYLLVSTWRVSQPFYGSSTAMSSDLASVSLSAPYRILALTCSVFPSVCTAAISGHILRFHSFSPRTKMLLDLCVTRSFTNTPEVSLSGQCVCLLRPLERESSGSSVFACSAKTSRHLQRSILALSRLYVKACEDRHLSLTPPILSAEIICVQMVNLLKGCCT